MLKEIAAVILVIGAATAGTLGNYADRVGLSDEGEKKANFLVKQYECTQQEFQIVNADSDSISIENTGEKDISEIELTWEYQSENNTKNTLQNLQSGETKTRSTLGTGDLQAAYAEIPGCILKTETYRP
ncbi:MAG: hypothetical protein ACI977_000091 [Candidatus Nanohaloarchaea archaeon]|jgi:hypothetical protein